MKGKTRMMRLRIERTRMCTGGENYFSYRVLVPMVDAPTWVLADSRKFNPTRIVISGDNAEYLEFADATVSRAHVGMEKGWERLQHWNEHEARAKKASFDVAKSVYPELDALTELPSVMAHFGHEMDGASHATKYVDLVIDPFGYEL